MPIKGLTGQPNAAPRAMAILRKGSPKQQKNGKEIQGKDLDHFRLDPQFQGEGLNKQVLEIFHQAYGKEPRAINIWLMDPNPTRNFEAWMEAYGPGYLKARCDRETITLWYNGYRYVNEPRPCKFNEETQSCPLGCKQVGRLLFWIPELFKAGYSGPVLFETHSKHDIANIDSTVNWLSSLTDNIRSIPLTLERVQEEITRPAFNGKERVEGRGKMKSWLVRLSAPADWVEERNRASQQLAIAPGVIPQLPQVKPLQLPQAATTSETVSEPDLMEAEIMEDPLPEVAARIQLLRELTGCPYSVIERLVHEMGKTIGTLTEIESRKLRSMVFLEWAYLACESRSADEIRDMFRVFWGNGRTGDDTQLFQQWKVYVQKIAV